MGYYRVSRSGIPGTIEEILGRSMTAGSGDQADRGAGTSTSRSEPLVVTEADGVGMTTSEPFVRHVKVLLSPMLQPGIGDFAVGVCEVPPHQMGSLHTHAGAAEIWMFSEGEGRATVGDLEITTQPGTVVYTPPGVSHQFFNTGDVPVKLFWMYSPSGPEEDVVDARFG